MIKTILLASSFSFVFGYNTERIHDSFSGNVVLENSIELSFVPSLLPNDVFHNYVSEKMINCIQYGLSYFYQMTKGDPSLFMNPVPPLFPFKDK